MSQAAPASGGFLMHSATAPQMHGPNHAVAGGRDLEAYGYSGFPGSPILSAGLYETRQAALNGLRPLALATGSRTWGSAPASGSGLPDMNHPDGRRRLGEKPRAAIAVFDLMSSVSFVPPGAPHAGFAELRVGNVPLAMISRPQRAYFEGQLELVEAEAALRDRRYAEVLTQVAPPLAYYASIVGLQGERHRHTLHFLNLALDFTYAVTARFKHALACPRPSEYTTVIQPMIEVPMHPSFPAGHAVEGHVLAGLLSALAAHGKMQAETSSYLRRAAGRIAQNRVVAGLHFPIDLVAGRMLGDALASYLLACSGDPTANCSGMRFDGQALAPANAGTDKFDPDAQKGSDPRCEVLDSIPAAAQPFLKALWTDATNEWV